jgi:hypothetical protein
MGWNSSYTIPTFVGMAFVIIAWSLDIFYALYVCRRSYTAVNKRYPTAPLCFSMLLLFTVGWIMILISYVHNIENSSSNSIQLMTSSLLDFAIAYIGAAVFITVAAAGSFWVMYTNTAVSSKRVCFLIGFAVALVAYWIAWGVMISFLALSTTGTFLGFAYASIVIPVAEPIAFTTGRQIEFNTPMWISTAARLFVYAGYVLFACAIANVQS